MRLCQKAGCIFKTPFINRGTLAPGLTGMSQRDRSVGEPFMMQFSFQQVK
jgi:hypothetical protein